MVARWIRESEPCVLAGERAEEEVVVEEEEEHAGFLKLVDDAGERERERSAEVSQRERERANCWRGEEPERREIVVKGDNGGEEKK